jgi:3-deoxy-D-manno-octulosonate 8-phosphate phosphatase (KDO 8-P phosphatase)
MIADHAEKIKKIKVLAMDVDGVLTNGSINIDNEGREIKSFNVYDGFGINIIRKSGFRTAIISARSSEAVRERANDLKIDKVFQDAYPKINAYEEMLAFFGVKDEEVCFIGDDIPDLPILSRAGFAVSVPNGSKEAKETAHFVTMTPGGSGAVRELIEIILKTQNKWQDVLQNVRS